MLRFYAATFATVLQKLESAKALLGMDGIPVEEAREALAESMRDLVKELEGLPVAPSLLGQARDLQQNTERYGIETLLALSMQIQKGLMHDLATNLFFWVPASRKLQYVEPTTWFGEVIVTTFPDVRLDVRDCSRCMALTQWTAGVFHVMRILEHGLRALARRVNVAVAETVDFQNWHNIIERIDARLREMKQLPRDQRNDQEITFCANAASHFFAVKEAWRNHVSHGRTNYDEADALMVVQNVRDFMKALAA